MNIRTRIRSTMMRFMVSEFFAKRRRAAARRQGRKQGGLPCVHYFHEASDPYSHLAVQRLDLLRGKYSLPFEVHLVSSAEDAYRGDASRYHEWALGDAASIAAGYGVTFPVDAQLPSRAAVRETEIALAGLVAAQAGASNDNATQNQAISMEASADNATLVPAPHNKAHSMEAKRKNVGKTKDGVRSGTRLAPDSDFAAKATQLGEQLWLGQAPSAEGSLPESPPDKSDTVTSDNQLGMAAAGSPEALPDMPAEVASGNQLREQLGHYAGGMFYFEGEWYWGLDRLYLLEQRLIDEGFGTGPICVPRPVAQTKPLDQTMSLDNVTTTEKEAPQEIAETPDNSMPTDKSAPQEIAETPDNSMPTVKANSLTPAELPDSTKAVEITLEYFPSLRSPYTAISFDRVMALADRTGVNLVFRPVMPMMMRGVPAPRAKQIYVMTDAAREGRAAGSPFGRMVDPFGEPVLRAFSLLPLLQAEGRVRDFVSRYLQAAWKDGIDITTDKGLKQVVTDIGLDWQQARESMNNSQWEAILEANVNAMLDAGLWGVPSFRVISNSTPTFSCWGQDRLWRVEQEIIDRRATTFLNRNVELNQPLRPKNHFDSHSAPGVS